MWTPSEYEEQSDEFTAELDGDAADGAFIWSAATPPTRRRRRERSVVQNDGPPSGGHHSDSTATPAVRVGLVLYMSTSSAHSQRALGVLRGVIAQCEPGQVNLQIIDLALAPEAGSADKIAYTPTLVKEFPGPKAWVVGNLENPQLVLDLLSEYLVDCADGRGNGHEQLHARKPTVQ